MESLEEKEIKVEVIEHAGKKWDRKSLMQLGIMIFITFVCCTLFFFAVLRFEGFTDFWNKVLYVAQPIIIGLVLAYLLNPIMKFFEKPFSTFFSKKLKKEQKAQKVSRTLAVICTIFFLIVIIALLIWAVVPSVVASVHTLLETMPDYVKHFVTMIKEGRFGKTELADWVSKSITEVTNYIEEWAQTKLLPSAQVYVTQITSGVYSVVKGVLNFIIGIIVAIYVMMIQETLIGQSKKIIFVIFKPKQANAIIHTVRKSSEIFGGFISGKLVDSLIIGIICYIGCVILKIPNAILIAVIIGVTNIIPFFGPIIGAVPSILFVVIQSPIHALYLLIFIIVLQQVDGNIIGPKILGNSTGLSSFWVMFAILVFGGLWGFFGMLLGVPIMAVLYYIISKLVRTKLKKRGLPESTAAYIHARGIEEETNTLRYTKSEDQSQGEDKQSSSKTFSLFRKWRKEQTDEEYQKKESEEKDKKEL
jgi:predicted PurR-regulated permease PerM